MIHFSLCFLFPLLLVHNKFDIGKAFGVKQTSHHVSPESPCKSAKHSPHDRRSFLATATSCLSGGMALAFVLPPKFALAADGDSAKMELPNYIEFLMEKNAVADPDSFLYKGPDPQVQLKRLLEASKRLQDIPQLAEDKKWSQVQGILTGPLGTLGQTLNLITKDSSLQSSSDVQAKAKKLKESILGISSAATQKNGPGVIAKTKVATQELEAFVRAAF